MRGMPHLVLAVIGIPTAWQCFKFAAPFLAIVVLQWMVRHTDHAVNRLFPHWEWEKQLGWLDLRTQRRAEAVLSWIGYFLYALLAAALYGIVWSAPALGELDRFDESNILGDLALKLPVFFICLGLWLVYLGFELLPKLRRKHDMDELDKFRAEQAARKMERDPESDSRLVANFKKPRLGQVVRSGRLGPGN